MNSQTIGIAAGILNAILIVPYVYSIFKGWTKPSRVTWFIWFFLSWVLLIASLTSGAHSTSFWLMSAAFNSTIIAFLSIWKGIWEKDVLDIVCFTLGIFGVVLWIITSKAEYSVYVSVLVDIIAIIPTVRKVWKNPESEPKISWTGGFIGAVLNTLAIDSTRLAVVIVPITVLFWHVLVLVPMYFRRNILKNL